MWKVKICVCVSVLSFFCANGEESCDKLGILLYEDIGCKPVYKEGTKCPIKYECEDFAGKSENCVLRGRTFDTHEHVNNSLTYPSCKVGCFCNEKRKFVCAILDCPEWLGSPVTPGCYRKYEADKCCSVGQICPTNETGTCDIDGQKVQEGELFYPKNTCTRCVCPSKFTGKLEDPHCLRTMCNVQIRDSDKLAKVCAPFYSAADKDVKLCCPAKWICPSKDDEIIKIIDVGKENPDLTCKFGSKELKLGEGLQKEFDYYGTTKKAKCECILPPFLTCKEV